jgi:hypothetical protein
VADHLRVFLGYNGSSYFVLEARMNCCTLRMLRPSHIIVICLSIAASPVASANEEFFAAARKGDAVGLKSHLDATAYH